MIATIIATFALAPVAGAQTLYVSDFSSDTVRTFDPATGAFQSTLIVPGDNVLRPHGILDRGADILIAAFDSNAVFRIDADTHAISTFIGPATGIANPVYILERSDGDLLISSQGSDEILRFAGDGTPLGALVVGGAGGLDGPSGMAIVGGTLYVAGRYSANVLAYDAGTGAFQGVIADASDGLGAGVTFGVQVAPNGDLYVASNNAVHRIDLDTNAVVATIPVGFPIGIEIEPATGDIMVATGSNVRRIDADTNALSAPILSGVAIASLNFFHYASPEPACAGDVNADGLTNSADFNILASNFGNSVTPNTSGDLTGDGLVNSADFNVLAGDFGCGG